MQKFLTQIHKNRTNLKSLQLGFFTAMSGNVHFYRMHYAHTNKILVFSLNF